MIILNVNEIIHVVLLCSLYKDKLSISHHSFSTWVVAVTCWPDYLVFTTIALPHSHLKHWIDNTATTL